MKHLLKHLFLFIILIGSDILIGFYGHYHGSGEENIIEYITKLTITDIIPVVGVALFVVFFVEFYFRRK